MDKSLVAIVAAVLLVILMAYMWDPKPQPTATVSVAQYKAEDYIHEGRLADGTRCVFHFRGGVTCEWRQP